jgi:hypothetical protein
MIKTPHVVPARRRDRSDKYYEHLAYSGALASLVQHFLPGRRFERQFIDVINHDERAALVCAITALCVAAGRYVAVGDEDGWIVLPPHAFIQSWAQEALKMNADQEGGSALYHSSGLSSGSRS